MRRIFLTVLLSILIASFAFPLSSSALTEGVAISTCTELMDIGGGPADESYYLISDIDCTGDTYSPISFGNSVGFTGQLDGNRFEIYNLEIDAGANPGGLFNYLTDATIKDLDILSSTVTSSSAAGMLAGSMTNTLVESVNTLGTVTSTGYAAGGLAGQAEGSTIRYSSTSGDVNGNFLSGGVVGYFFTLGTTPAIMEFTNTNADVTTNTFLFAGGLIGQASAYGNGENGDLTISNSYATGNVNAGSASRVGGLIGELSNDSGVFTSTITLTNSYSAGTVSGDASVGGLVGLAANDDNENNLVINNTVSVSPTTGNTQVAGWVGLDNDSNVIGSANWFGTASTGQSVCVSNSSPSNGCAGFIDSGFGAGHWLGNDSVSPFNEWNFDSNAWEVVDGVLPILDYDFDQDGLTTEAEKDGPNGGDVDEDSTPDYEQENVASFIDGDDAYGIIALNGYLHNVRSSTIQDEDGYTIPHGALSFIVVVDSGESTTIEIFFKSDLAPEDVVAVKKSESGPIVPLTNFTITNETIDGDNFIKLSYDATDGGENDEDGQANGLIVDPVALAIAPAQTTTTSPSQNPTQATGTLPATGSPIQTSLVAALVILGLGIVLTRRKNFI